MQFNYDLKKQANEITFSLELVLNNLLYLAVKFNNNNITRYSHQKHSGVILTSTLILIKKSKSPIKQ